MARQYEVRFGGTGGQGAILAGILLAEAAIRDGKNVAQTQSYGPEARGGASRSEVVISDGEIDYPKVIQADITLCMSQEACDRYGRQMSPGGLLILDSDHVTRAPTMRAVQVPLTQLARDEDLTVRSEIPDEAYNPLITPTRHKDDSLRAQITELRVEVLAELTQSRYDWIRKVVSEYSVTPAEEVLMVLTKTAFLQLTQARADQDDCRLLVTVH